MRNGCGMDAKWMRNGCEMDAKWMRNGSEMDAKRMRNGCETDVRPFGSRSAAVSQPFRSATERGGLFVGCPPLRLSGPPLRPRRQFTAQAVCRCAISSVAAASWLGSISF